MVDKYLSDENRKVGKDTVLIIAHYLGETLKKIAVLCITVGIFGCDDADPSKTYRITQFPSGKVWETHNYLADGPFLWFTDDQTRKRVGIGIASARVEEINDHDYTIEESEIKGEDAFKRMNEENKKNGEKVFSLQQKSGQSGWTLMSRPRFQR